MEKKILTERTEAQPCPACSYSLDAFTNMTGEDRPQPGDQTVCINCASVLKWDDNMKFKLSSLMEVPTSVRRSFARIVEKIKEVNKERSEHL